MVAQLYQKAIMAAAKEAHGAGRLSDADASATVDNPLCGDRITLDVKMDDGQVAQIGHRVRGCLLCEAAASVLGAKAAGLPRHRLHEIAEAFESMIRQDGPTPQDWPELDVFTPVKAVKSRHECVLLPFNALLAAVDSTATGRSPDPAG